MRALREPDAFPSSDLGLIRAMKFSSAHELEACAEAWRPWRAYAAIHLWSTSHTEDVTSTSAIRPLRETDSRVSATSA